MTAGARALASAPRWAYAVLAEANRGNTMDRRLGDPGFTVARRGYDQREVDEFLESPVSERGAAIGTGSAAADTTRAPARAKS